MAIKLVYDDAVAQDGPYGPEWLTEQTFDELITARWVDAADKLGLIKEDKVPADQADGVDDDVSTPRHQHPD